MDENGKKNFLEQLRASDEGTKRKIIIITSCICMVIVLYVWLGYFNNLVSGAARPETVSHPSSSGFWDGVKGDMGIFYQKISGVFGTIFQWSKQYTIQPQR